MSPNFVLIALAVSALGVLARLARARPAPSSPPDDTWAIIESFHSPGRRKVVVTATAESSWESLERLARQLVVDRRAHVVFIEAGRMNLLYAADARGWRGEDSVERARWIDGEGKLWNYTRSRGESSEQE